MSRLSNDIMHRGRGRRYPYCFTSLNTVHSIVYGESHINHAVEIVIAMNNLQRNSHHA
ncbi:MAG: hypothetical protein QW200_07615 [Ignisphaera sp.]